MFGREASKVGTPFVWHSSIVGGQVVKAHKNQTSNWSVFNLQERILNATTLHTFLPITLLTIVLHRGFAMSLCENPLATVIAASEICVKAPPTQN